MLYLNNTYKHVISYLYELWEVIMEIPKGHYIFGTVKVGERGQIIIPKEARDKFDIKAGDTLIVLGDEKWGIAVTKSDVLQRYAADVFSKIAGEDKNENR